MFVIQRYSGSSYWSKDEGWDELLSANKFENEEAARKVMETFDLLASTPADEIKIITLEEAIKNETDTTP